MPARIIRGEAKDLYDGIRLELIRTFANWRIFRQLFATNDERYLILNNTAPGFFTLIKDVLVDNAVITLSRLTDPRGYDSLVRLVALMENQIHHALHEELEQALSAIQSQCEDIREHRDRRVAHRERKGESPSFEEGPVQLPPITRQKIEGAMADMAELMNRILGTFTGDYQIYEPVIRGE